MRELDDPSMKQIMEFSGTNTYNNSSAFANSDEDDDEENDDVFPTTYGFHLMPPFLSSPSRPSALTNYNSVDDNGSAKVTQKKFGTLYEETLVSVIDRKMKEHTDNLLHAVEGLSPRLSQLDSRKRHLENSLDELKESVECSHKSTDGKLRQLENMLREVQGGVLDLRDKQEIAEAQLQLAMLQVSKCDPQSEKQNKSAGTHFVQLKSSSASKESHKSLPNPVTFPQPFPTLPLNAPRNPPYENSELPPAAAQRPTQVFQNEMPSLPRPECYPPPRAPTQETTHEEYYRTPTQQSRPLPPAPHQLYPLAFQFPQMQQSIQQHLVHSPPSTGSPQAHPPMDYQDEGSSYISSQSYHQGIHQTYSQPPGGAPPTPQFYMSSTQKLHDQALNRPSSKFIPGYPPPGGYTSSSDYNPHTESPPFYVSSGARPSYPVHPPSVPSGDSSYPQLPTAKILPHALPTASSMNGGSGSSETGNRVPVDDVVDKVSAMGFRRDQVRAMVKKLTDNGQAVDLNVVLDKLMNNG